MIPYLRRKKFGEGLLNGTITISQIIANHAKVNFLRESNVMKK